MFTVICSDQPVVQLPHKFLDIRGHVQVSDSGLIETLQQQKMNSTVIVHFYQEFYQLFCFDTKTTISV